MNQLINRFVNLLLLLLGIESLCKLLEESFSLQLPPATYIWLALLCLLLWFASGFRYGLFLGMPASAAVLYYLYHTYSFDLLSELREVLEHISIVYYGQFSGEQLSSVEQSSTGNHMFAVLLVFFILAAFVSTALTSGSFRVSLSMLATLPLFAICIAVNGKPSILPVIGTFLFWIGLQLGGDAFRMNDGGGKAFLIGTIPVLITLFSLLLLYRPSTYIPNQTDFDLSQRFDKLGNVLSQWISDDNPDSHSSDGGPFEMAVPEIRAPRAWDDGGDTLDLTVTFDYSKLYEEAFRVRAETSGSLYFRGKSYGDYAGSRWESAVENNHGQALSYAAQTIAANTSAHQSVFHLDTDKIYDILYLPYFSISAPGSDVSVTADGINSYSGEYHLPDFDLSYLQTLGLPSSLVDEELQYRQYVHSYYTRLPEVTRAVMTELCSAQGFDRNSSGLIWHIAEFVRSQGEYDVDVAPYPSDDYASYFLLNSHRGYCIHFATAAAVLFRCLDIPARVCEGYLVNTEPGSTIVVRGTDAHAWVEVYLDGIGWIPVEVTASAGDPSQTSGGTSTPAPSPVFPESDANTSDTQHEEAVPDSENNEDPVNPHAISERDSVQSGSQLLLTFLGSLIILLSLIFGRYAIMRNMILKRLNHHDNRKRAINCYLQAMRVLRYGGEMPVILLEIAEKARFSQHDIEKQEITACSEALEDLTNTVYTNLSRLKKILFRFWSANI